MLRRRFAGIERSGLMFALVSILLLFANFGCYYFPLEAAGAVV